jgi:uncharacterized protein (TIGR02391 family)
MADKQERHLTQGQIEKIAHILGDTQSGLTGTEIGFMLSSCDIKDVNPEFSKWKRLYNAFVERHNKTGTDNFILKFIAKALEPARFAGKSDQLNYLSGQLNVVLSFLGLAYKDDGYFHNVKATSTLTEAEMRVANLKRAILERNLHPTLLDYCRAELLNDNYFHAVLEAVKGIASIIRKRTGLTNDGAELIKDAFGGEDPKIKINSFQLETEKSEQRGFLNLLVGIFGTFRNPTAHAAKIEWNLEEQDALDIFSIVSYAVRRIDETN